MRSKEFEKFKYHVLEAEKSYNPDRIEDYWKGCFKRYKEVVEEGSF